MALAPGWRAFIVLWGLLISIAGVYTIRYPKRERARALRYRNFDRRIIIQQVNDPKRIQETQRGGWFGLLMGLVFVAAGLAPSEDLSHRVALFSLILPFLYVVTARTIRENVHVVVILLLATVFGLLVAVSVVPGDLQRPLALGIGVVVILNLLAGNPLGYGDTYAQKTFHYRCIRCGHEFETSVVNMAEATCPDCGATRVTTVVPER